MEKTVKIYHIGDMRHIGIPKTWATLLGFDTEKTATLELDILNKKITIKKNIKKNKKVLDN